MGRFDKATEDFMEKLASEKNQEPDKPDLSKLRTLKSVVKSIQDPHKAIGKAIVSTATMKALFDKEAGLKVLGLYGILNERFGREWWHWEPETIWQTLEKEEAIKPGEDMRNLISALQLVVVTNQPFENWHVFEKVGQAFNFNPVDFGTLQPLELNEIALTLKLLRAIRPKQAFDSEICAYLAAAAKNAGVVYLPKEVFTEGCQSFLNNMGNDIELADKLASGSDLDSIEVQIQKARLKEIELYVAEKF